MFKKGLRERDYVLLQPGTGQSLNAKITAGYITQDILEMEHFLQAELAVSHVYRLPLMPRFIQGQVHKTEKIDNYNAVAEQKNPDLQTLVKDDDVIKFFHAGKQFHFRGSSYLDRVDTLIMMVYML